MMKTYCRNSVMLLLTAGTVVCGATAYAKPAQSAKKPPAPAAATPTEQAWRWSQFSAGGPYKESPRGKKVCFPLPKPTSATSEPPGRKRDPSYAFVSTRPGERVKNEVSVIVGYPQKAGVDASATVGSAKSVMI